MKDISRHFTKKEMCCAVLSCSIVSDSLSPKSPLSLGTSQERILEKGCHVLLQGIFPTQGSNPGLLHCSPIILDWVAFPFSGGIFLTHEFNQDLLHCRRILHQLKYQGSPKRKYICQISTGKAIQIN